MSEFNDEILVMVFAILLIPFFKPAGLDYYPLINTIFKGWKIASIAGIVLVLFFYGDNYHAQGSKLSKESLFSLLSLTTFECIVLSDEILFGTSSVQDTMSLIVNPLLFYFLLRINLSSVKRPFYNALYYVFKVLLISQIISIVIVKSGHIIFQPQENDFTYLMGTDNYSAFAVLPMITSVLYLGMQKSGDNKLCTDDQLLLLALTIVYGYLKSATAFLSLLILSVLIILRRYKKKIIASFSVKRMIVCIIIFLVLVLKFNVQNYFANFVSEIFNKKGNASITLNSRTYIWPLAMKLIKKQFLFGYGTLSQQTIKQYVLFGVDHAHNILLDLMLKAGIIGSVLFFVFVSICFSRAKKNYDSGNSYILIFGLLSFLVLSVMDFYPLTTPQYVLYGLLYCCPDFLGDSGKESTL